MAPNDFCLLTDIKQTLQGNIFGSNEEVIVATEAFFETKYKLFYKKKFRNIRGTLDFYSDEEVTFLQNVFFLVTVMDFSADVSLVIIFTILNILNIFTIFIIVTNVVKCKQ